MHVKVVSTLLRSLGRLLAMHGDTALHDLPLPSRQARHHTTVSLAADLGGQMTVRVEKGVGSRKSDARAPAVQPKLVPPCAMYRLTEPVLSLYCRIASSCSRNLLKFVLAIFSPQRDSHPVLQKPQNW